MPKLTDCCDTSAADAQALAAVSLQLLAGSSQDIVMHAKADGTILGVSPSCHQLLGYSPDRLTGMSIFALMQPDDATRAQAQPQVGLWSPGESDDVISGPAAPAPPWRFRCRHADDSYRWLESRCRTLLNSPQPAAAEIGQVLIWWRDITAAVALEEQLKAVSAEYETIFAASTEIMALVDVGDDGHFRYRKHTPAAATYFSLVSGMDAQDMCGKTVCEVAGTALGSRVEADMADCVRQAVPASFDRSHRGYSWHTVLSPVVCDGHVRQIIVSCQDTTESKQRAAQLQASEARFRRLAENARDLVYRVELLPERRQEYINPAVERILGYTPEQVYSDPTLSARLVHPEDAAARESMERGEFAPDDTVVIRWFHRDGHQVWLEHKPIAVHDQDGRLIALEGIGRDITDRVLLEREVLRLGLTDKLTGLPNRAQFDMLLQRHDEAATAPLALIMGDLNGLKVVNGGWGYATGDRLLRLTAELLCEAVPEYAQVCRWGGDEFVILLPGADDQHAGAVCGLIHRAFAAAPDAPVRPSIALGTAARMDDSRTTAELMQEAEDRMHRNKLVQERSAHSAIIVSLQRTLAERTHETEEHARRLNFLCAAIGSAISLSEGELADLALLAILHDVGKVAVPDGILTHPGRLSPDDMEIMRRHCEIGHRIASSCPDLAHIASAILHHHERWDGAGYPRGLKGCEIPLISRVLAIVDAYDVMTNGRPYRDGIPASLAMAEIERCAGSHFDPDLVRVFLNVNSASHSGAK